MAAPENHLKKLEQNDILFREGDPSESMYVVKKGRLVVFKLKGTAEVELASVGPGSMVGEMAFFDRKQRSASIKAAVPSEVIEIPFKNLQAQYNTFPEWLKSIVKTINDHLREANKRIKNLEQVNANDANVKGLPPHQANKLCSIIMFCAIHWGEPEPTGGIDVKPGVLRKLTIQIFGEPTSKMQTMIGYLEKLNMMKFEDLGEGKAKVTLLRPDILYGFVEWFNDYLYTPEDKKITITPEDMKILRALIHYSQNVAPDDKGYTKISLTTIQSMAQNDLGYPLTANDFGAVINKGYCSDRIQEKDGIFVKVNRADLLKFYPYWQIVHTLVSGVANPI